MEDKDVHDEVQKLRKTLIAAKNKIIEQQDALKELTTPPYNYATVVMIKERNKNRFSTGNLTIAGTRVLLKKDSEFAYQSSVPGAVQGKYHDKGWVSVKWDNGDINNYRIGLPDVDDGVCDIEPVEKEDYFDTVVICIEGKFMEILYPKGIEVNPGDTVTVVSETMQIIDVSEVKIGGTIGHLRQVIDETFSEVDYESSVKVVFNGKFYNQLEKGDRVVLDITGNIIINNLGKKDEKFNFNTETNVIWDDICGLYEAKKQMMEAVELPHKNPEIFSFYKKKPVKGVLLYGPPGCGKTMLGKAAATSLANIYKGKMTESSFIYIKGPEILDRYVGTAEAAIRSVFERARKHKKEYGYPSVIFIDEADAILPKRGSGISSDIEKTIVPMFLTEMDGLEDSGALIILATNRSDVLDPAVIRDGRIDRKIKIDRPDKQSVKNIIMSGLEGIPLNNGYSYEELAELGKEYLFSDKHVLCTINTKSNGVINFHLRSVINGAMAVNVIEQATSIALHRDLEKNEQGGLCKTDITSAIDTILKENIDLNHSDEIGEFVHDFHDDITGIKKFNYNN